MSRTRTICSSVALLAALWAGSALGADPAPAAATPDRIVRPEGYIQIEAEDAGTSSGGSFSLSPALHTPDAPTASPEEVEPEPTVVPPRRKTARQLCQPIADRFTMRLAELRGGSDAGALDPVLQRDMFGRVALSAMSENPDQSVPEVSWDDELKDLRRTYRKCLKAERR